MKNILSTTWILGMSLAVSSQALAQSDVNSFPNVQAVNSCISHYANPLVEPEKPKRNADDDSDGVAAEFWHPVRQQKIFGARCVNQDLLTEQNGRFTQYTYVFATPDGFRRLTLPVFHVRKAAIRGGKMMRDSEGQIIYGESVQLPRTFMPFLWDGQQYYIGEQSGKYFNLVSNAEKSMNDFGMNKAFGRPIHIPQLLANFADPYRLVSKYVMHPELLENMRDKPMQVEPHKNPGSEMNDNGIVSLSPIDTDPAEIQRDIDCLSDQIEDLVSAPYHFGNLMPTEKQMELDKAAQTPRDSEVASRYAKTFEEIRKNDRQGYLESVPVSCQVFISKTRINDVVNKSYSLSQVQQYKKMHDWITQNALPLDSGNGFIVEPADSSKLKIDTTKMKVDTTKMKVDTTKMKVDTTKMKVDTTKMKVDTTKMKVDTTKMKVDTTKMKVDTTQAKPTSGAAPTSP